VVVFIDDILKYSKNHEECERHLRIVTNSKRETNVWKMVKVWILVERSLIFRTCDITKWNYSWPLKDSSGITLATTKEYNKNM